MKKSIVVLGILLALGFGCKGGTTTPIIPDIPIVPEDIVPDVIVVEAVLEEITKPTPFYKYDGKLFGFKGEVKNTGNKKCVDYGYFVKLYDKDGVILFDMKWSGHWRGNQFPNVLEGLTKKWHFNFQVHGIRAKKVQKIDVSKSVFVFYFCK